MSQTATETKKDISFRVRVSGWSNSRQVHVKNGIVHMEVARMACRHCSTCSARVHQVGVRFGNDAVQTPIEGGLFIGTSLPENSLVTPKAVAEFLSTKLGIAIAAIG